MTASPTLPDSSELKKVAVLTSGGIDSCVLVHELSRLADQVVPIHMRFGLRWEEDELAALQVFLAAIASPTVAPLRSFELPLDAVYERHWSMTGNAVPGQSTPDDAVYLPGRNLFQFVQPAVWCHLNGVGHLCLATLARNPFADATPAFFSLLENTLNTALDGKLKILRPYETLDKAEVIRRGRDLPLERTMSCIQPVDCVHCGVCNKCAERRRAFARAEVPDRTSYAQPAHP